MYDSQAKARQEIRDENFRILVEEEKKRIRLELSSKKWWHRFVPFVVSIQRRK